MRHQTRWLIENRVTLSEFSGQVSMEDARADQAELQSMIATGTAPVHIIIDLSRVERLNLGLGDVRGFKPSSSSPANEQTGMTVIVGQNSIVRMFASLVVQLIGANYRFFATRAEALAFLNQHDPTLPDLFDSDSNR